MIYEHWNIYFFTRMKEWMIKHKLLQKWPIECPYSLLIQPHFLKHSAMQLPNLFLWWVLMCFVYFLFDFICAVQSYAKFRILVTTTEFHRVSSKNCFHTGFRFFFHYTMEFWGYTHLCGLDWPRFSKWPQFPPKINHIF